MNPTNCFFCQKLARLDELPQEHQLPEEEVVWQFPHSVAFLGPWQYYTGYCILVVKTHATELSQLPPAERRGYLDELCLLAQAIEQSFQPHKLNYELLGNLVPHLHWHLFPRSQEDPEKLRPVWFALDRAETDLAERQRLQTSSIPRVEITQHLRHQLETLQAPGFPGKTPR